MTMGLYLSINVNRLNAPTKRQRLAEWIKKQDPYIYIYIYANADHKKAGVEIFISDKIGFEIKAMKRDKGHYIMIKGSIQEEDITIINIYAPNIGAPQYVRQMLTSMKGEINNNTIIVGDFNTYG